MLTVPLQGAMTFGEEGKEGGRTQHRAYVLQCLTSITGARVTNLKDLAAILDIFQAHGHSEVSL